MRKSPESQKLLEATSEKTDQIIKIKKTEPVYQKLSHKENTKPDNFTPEFCDTLAGWIPILGNLRINLLYIWHEVSHEESLQRFSLDFHINTIDHHFRGTETEAAGLT